MRLVCPKCQSENITFGRDILTYRYWQQASNEVTDPYDYEENRDGDTDFVECPINCHCRDCAHVWTDPDHEIDDYLLE